MERIYIASRIATVAVMLVISYFIPLVLIMLPFAIWFNEKGIQQYQKYDGLAFYKSLSDGDKESLDWYL
jgi:hypothetical protein